MKKLLLAMGCFAAIVLTVSCSADNLEETKSYPPKNFSASTTDPIDVTNPPLDDIGGRDKSKTKV